jgi:hypothetical protein
VSRGFGRGLVVLAAAWALLTFACEKHPSNPEIPSALCEPRCQRDHDCDPTFDVAGCVNDCKRMLSPRVVYEREDWVATVRACAQRQACVSDVDRFILSCVADAYRRLEPTAEALTYCQRRQVKDASCHMIGRMGFEHCIYGIKTYSDPILGQLNDCVHDEACRNYGRCILAVIGDDPYAADRDRVEQYRNEELPEAGPPTVTVHGHVQTFAGAPIAQAMVCLHGSEAPQACVTADAGGAYSLSVPAHGELALTAAASGFQTRLSPLTTVGRDVKDWIIGLPNESTMTTRYGATGGTYPDSATGFVMVTAEAPRGSQTGIVGVVMSIEPSSGRGPVYFADNSDPDPRLTATSTFSSALFANVQPGIVELTFGPDSITCVPDGTGWPSNRANSIRLPIVAGLETRVSMRCHK